MSAPLDIRIQGFEVREWRRRGERVVDLTIPPPTSVVNDAVVVTGDPVKVTITFEQFEDFRIFMAVVLSAKEKLVQR